MNCTVCTAGQLRAGRTDVTKMSGDVVVVYRHVPAEVCDNCGEAFLDLATARELEQAIAVDVAAGVRYAVREFGDLAHA